MKKITLESGYGIYSVGLEEEVEALDAVFENLIIPVLLAAGYGQETINDYLDVETPAPWESRRARPGEDEGMGI